LLAAPEKHWKAGYSARALAESWEAADGWPPEIAEIFVASAVNAFADVRLLLAIPEFQVDLPPRGKPSQSDLFALGKSTDGNLVAVTVEGKVGESFGPTLAEWNSEGSSGKSQRLEYLKQRLGLLHPLPPTVRYQLLHRTASAQIAAGWFNAQYAVMLVHSFSPLGARFEDYQAFLRLFDVRDAVPGRLYALGNVGGIGLFAAWVSGKVARHENQEPTTSDTQP
jgi:hypothetical protein